MHGYVLTQVPNAQYLYEFLRKDRADLLTIIPAWGLPWNDATIRAIALCATQETFIRTSSGDPSRGIAHAYLLPETLTELEPFLTMKPHCHIILGNEPNLPYVDFWVYRYWLLNALQSIRSRYPHARIISPAPIVATQYMDLAQRFYAVCQDALLLCDYSGVHAYAHTTFDDDGQLQRATMLSKRYLGDMPMALTEYGINSGTIKSKLMHYRTLRARNDFYAYCAFHIATDRLYPQYNITLGDI